MLANQSYIVANPGQYAIQQTGGQMLAETPTPRVNQKYGTVHHDRPLVRGKTSPYGFFVKMCYEEHKKKYPNENVQVTEISKKCSQKWKTMTEDEKKRFYELAQKDAERYQAEVAAYGGEDVLRKRKRAKKDPNAPKRALSAFFFFSNEKRPEVQQSHPEWKVGQVAQELGRFWKALDEDARVIYEKKAQADKERYAEEMSVYRNEMQMVKMSMKQQQQPVPLQQMTAASSSGSSGGGATLGSVLAAGGGPSLLQQHQSPSQSASQSRQNPQQMVIISGSGTGTTSGSAAQSGQLPMQILEEHIAMNNV